MEVNREPIQRYIASIQNQDYVGARSILDGVILAKVDNSLNEIKKETTAKLFNHETEIEISEENDCDCDDNFDDEEDDEEETEE